MLIAVRVPIAYTMILVGIAGTMIQSGPAVVLNQLKDLAYAQFSNYDLSVLPMFILMGGARLALRPVAATCSAAPTPGSAASAAAWRWRRSPPAPASARSAAPRPRPPRRWGRWRCRSSGATATRRRSPPARIAAGGTLGILIPPSVVLIVYAIIVEANIVTMFAAALIPGLLAALFFIADGGDLRARSCPAPGPEGEAVPRERARRRDGRR